MTKPLSNRQKIYNRVRKHLLKQNKKCKMGPPYSVCRYRFNGLKCAIGALIPNKKYKTAIEGVLPGSVLVNHTIRLPSYVLMRSLLLEAGATDGDAVFLRELQLIHDIVSVKDWVHSLNAFADKWALKYE